jgi:nucleotide-binding universal stress UspA family protein
MHSGFERLVVPVAGSATDDRVLDILPQLLSGDGAMVTFLFVVEVPQSMPLDAELPAEVDAGERALRHAETSARRTLPARTTHVLSELLQARAIGPAIVDEAIDRNADAIIMTAAIHRKHGRPTLGGTIEHVLLHAPCEVVVIRIAPGLEPSLGAQQR